MNGSRRRFILSASGLLVAASMPRAVRAAGIILPPRRLSTARYFNGTSSDTLQATMASTSDQTFSALSVAVWINSTSSGTKSIFRRGDQTASPYVSYGLAQLANGTGGSVGDGWDFMVGTGGGITHLVADNNSSGGNPVVFGRWAHLAGTWDGTTMRVFVNGVEKKNVANAGTMAALDTHFSIGYDVGFGEYWLGSLAHVAVWNAALGLGEINALARGVLPPEVRQQSLHLYYPLSGNSSPEKNEISSKYAAAVTGTRMSDGPSVMAKSQRIAYFPAPAAASGGCSQRIALLGVGCK